MPSARLISWLTVFGLFVWVFGGALFGGGVWVFRDAGHYYYPLYQFTGEQLAGGTPAFWNPFENLGMPLVANPTSALFYPPAWIFALPLAPAWAFRLYVLGHVVLALGTSYRLARRWDASPTAAMIAALSYVFCGNVLYQVCNVVFLVGAAWMPLALLAADRMLQGRSFTAALGLGAVLAAMTLGGDPQAAYHAGLLATLYAVILWRRERTNVVRAVARIGWRPCRPLLLAVAAGAAFLLAAVQVLPSTQFTRHSGRGRSEVARSVWELASAERAEDTPRHGADGLLHRQIDPAMHHAHVYHFSVGPWRLAEYVWPNVAGRQFPTHRRWADAIPSEGRLWVPSLYMGTVPLLLALAALRFRKTNNARAVWLSWTVVLSVAASFGWFGIGWIVREIATAVGADQAAGMVGPPVGGLYWLMTVTLPGYVYFRYPAKLLALAAVALSMLAAVGWDQAFGRPSPRFRRVLLGLACTSMFGTAVAAVVWWFAPTVFRHVAANVMFGPLDARGAAVDILGAFAQSGLMLLAFWWFLGGTSDKKPWHEIAVLLLVAVDLGVANAWLIPTADAELWERPTWLAEQTVEQGQGESIVPPRVYRRPAWLPEAWYETTSPDRLEESLAWDRATGWPKHNLSSGLAVAEAHGTMMPHDYQVLLWYFKRRGGGVMPLEGDLAAVSVDYAVLKTGETPIGAGQRSAVAEDAKRDASLWSTPEPMPRAWFVPRVETLAPLETDNWRVLWRRTAEVFHPGGEARDLRTVAVVEASSEELATAGVPRSSNAEAESGEAKNLSGNHGECLPRAEMVRIADGFRIGSNRAAPLCRKSTVSCVGRNACTTTSCRCWAKWRCTTKCRITRFEPTRVEIAVDSSRPGLVVLAEQFAPGWKLDIETAGLGSQAAPILRTNRLMRGAWVAAGKYRLVYRYRPDGVLVGGMLSIVGWLVLAGVGIAAWRRGRDRKRFG